MVMANAKEYLSAAWASIKDVYPRCAIRFLLWCITIIGGVFPSIHAADVELTFNFYSVAEAVNQHGIFRDFFYIVVVISLVTICEILDLFARRNRPHTLVVPVYVCAFMVMIYMLIFGIGEFSVLVSKGTEKYVVPEERFHYDFVAIAATCGIGLMVEMLLAFRGE